MTRRAHIHAGFHKTGTTSIQAMLGRHRARLREAGLFFFEGAYNPDNHIELMAYALRATRTAPAIQRWSIARDDAFLQQTAARVTVFETGAGDADTLYSAEGVSLLAHADETARLARLFTARTPHFHFYVRERAAFIASFRVQMKRIGVGLPAPAAGFTDAQAEAWLGDFETRLDVFRGAFGRENVSVHDYDAAVAADASVVPSFLHALGVKHLFSDDEMRADFLNARQRAPQ